MTTLAENHCEACRANAARISTSELKEMQPDIPEWTLVQVEGVDQLFRQFKFKNFVQALEFANKVGEIAEENDHHPKISVEWGKVTVHWWTHKIKGLHKNDIIMAAKTDQLLR